MLVFELTARITFGHNLFVPFALILVLFLSIYFISNKKRNASSTNKNENKLVLFKQKLEFDM